MKSVKPLTKLISDHEGLVAWKYHEKVNLVVVPENFSGAVPSEIPASVSVVHPDFIRESVAKKQRLDESSYYGNKKEVKVDPECLPEAANVEEPEPPKKKQKTGGGVIWYYKSDLRKKGDAGWSPYSSEDSQQLEKGHQDKTRIVKLNSVYKADLKEMIQFRIEDTSRQRPIKRVLLGGDATNTENSD